MVLTDKQIGKQSKTKEKRIEFHDRTISNLGDYVAQTDKETDRQTDKAIYIVDELSFELQRKFIFPVKCVISQVGLGVGHV